MRGLPSHPCPVRLNGRVAYISRIAKRRSAARSAVRASASAASASPIGVVRTGATAGVSGNRLVDQELSDFGISAPRRRARRRAAGQGANRAGRPGETDAVRHLFVLRLGDAKPSRVALTELRNERPHLRRFRRSGERGVLVLQGIPLGRAVIPLNLHVSVAEGGAGQCQYEDLVVPLAADPHFDLPVDTGRHRDCVPRAPLDVPLGFRWQGQDDKARCCERECWCTHQMGLPPFAGWAEFYTGTPIGQPGRRERLLPAQRGGFRAPNESGSLRIRPEQPGRGGRGGQRCRRLGG